jgi:HD-like signal output (HDOD) protein
MTNQEATTNTEQINLTPDELINKLRLALSEEGDFPASAKVVSELQKLTSDPNSTSQQITEVILNEPSLGTRVLHMVNSVSYNRGAQIMTISQAVMRLGMKQLADICAGLVLLQKFVPASRRDGTFANALKKLLVTSLLSGALSDDNSRHAKNESGYLAGTFAEIGSLLLAYYFPKIFEAANQRTLEKNIPLEKSIFEITGVTPLKLSIEVLSALNLPDFYRELLGRAEEGSKAGSYKSPSNIEGALGSLNCARTISEAVCLGGSKEQLDKIILTQKNDKLADLVGTLPVLFKSHCAVLEVDLPMLPEFLSNYNEDNRKLPLVGSSSSSSDDQFTKYVEEIKQSIEEREPTASIITSVMETLAWGLGFSRVVLLLINQQRTALNGRMGLGKMNGIDPKKISRSLSAPELNKAADIVAFRECRPVFVGQVLLPDGWPVAALPVGTKIKQLGVIYCDKNNGADGELSARDRAAIGVLVELLERSINTGK